MKKKQINNHKSKVLKFRNYTFIIIPIFFLSILFYLYYDTKKNETEVHNFHKYIKEYPKGSLSEYANDILNWFYAKNLNTTISYNNYIDNNLNFIIEAKHELQQLQYDSTMIVNTTAAIRQFMVKYQTGENWELAKLQLAELVKDSTTLVEKIALETIAYKLAKKESTKTSFQKYLENFPTGIYEKDAKYIIGILDSLDFPVMVLISGGTFKMGSDSGEIDEKPIHSVKLSSFYIGRYEITNLQFSQFLNVYGKSTDDNGYTMIFETSGKNDWGLDKSGSMWKAVSGYEYYPVINVSWYGANQYCKWLSRVHP